MTFAEKRKDLLAHGFKEYSGDCNVSQRHHILFQKKVKDEKGIRYFVEATFWKHADAHEGWQWEVNYKDGCAIPPLAAMKIQSYCFEVEWTAVDLLVWAESLWRRLCPNYYERES